MPTNSELMPTCVDIDNEGFSSQFECRPETLYGQIVPAVVDASIVRERPAADLRVFRIRDVFAGSNEVFLGFGRPNAYLVAPDGNGGYLKFAGKSLKRAPSVIEDTRGFVQSGVLIRFKNLPAHAVEKIRAAMKSRSGVKYWTCVNANLRVLEDAGFASGSRPLSHRYFPYACLKSFLRDGLTFEGRPVDFDVVRTTPSHLESYTRKIRVAEYFTFCRHADRHLEPAARKSKLLALLNTMRPSRFITTMLDKDVQPGTTKQKPAPALPSNAAFPDDIMVRVSKASSMGVLLRQLWGPHTLFEAVQNRVSATDYFSAPLKPFPQPNPSLLTRLKKCLLFSRPVVWLVRRGLSPSWFDVGPRSVRDIHLMLRTHSEVSPNKYNIVVYGDAADPRKTTFTVSRLSPGRGKFVDWVMCKHVLMSGYAPLVYFAGEIWKDADGKLHISGNSGTYLPDDHILDSMVAYFKAVFDVIAGSGENLIEIVEERLVL